MTKLLIDECLSSELALIARERGHHEASHVVWIGKAGWKDWELKKIILEDDWVLVTKNSADFRGPANAPGSKGQYANISLHSGLICLNGPVGMDLTLQSELFREVLNQLDLDGDLTNQVLKSPAPMMRQQWISFAITCQRSHGERQLLERGPNSAKTMRLMSDSSDL